MTGRNKIEKNEWAANRNSWGEEMATGKRASLDYLEAGTKIWCGVHNISRRMIFEG